MRYRHYHAAVVSGRLSCVSGSVAVVPSIWWDDR